MPTNHLKNINVYIDYITNDPIITSMNKAIISLKKKHSGKEISIIDKKTQIIEPPPQMQGMSWIHPNPYKIYTIAYRKKNLKNIAKVYKKYIVK